MHGVDRPRGMAFGSFSFAPKRRAELRGRRFQRAMGPRLAFLHLGPAPFPCLPFPRPAPRSTPDPLPPLSRSRGAAASRGRWGGVHRYWPMTQPGGGPGLEPPGAAAGAPPAAGPARTASAPPLWALPGMDLSPVLSPRERAPSRGRAQTVAARLRLRRGPGRGQAPREGAAAAATDSREALRGGPRDANSSSTVIDDDLGSAVQSKLTTHQAQRGFFVRIVAQRELEVSEDKWIEVLARHAAQGLNRITGSKLRSARTGGARHSRRQT